MMNFLIAFVGYMCILFAVDTGRDEESRDKMGIFSRNWFIIMTLVFIGSQLIKYADKI